MEDSARAQNVHRRRLISRHLRAERLQCESDAQRAHDLPPATLLRRAATVSIFVYMYAQQDIDLTA